MLRRLGVIGVTVVVIFGLIQLLPVGRIAANPAIVREPAWDSPATRALAVRGCFDCHSSETVWPWYSKIAPASWVLSRDIAAARDVFSFSEWTSGDVSPARAARVTREREMPPSRYLMLHPEAKLTDAEVEQLAQGFLNSLE